MNQFMLLEILMVKELSILLMKHTITLVLTAKLMFEMNNENAVLTLRVFDPQRNINSTATLGTRAIGSDGVRLVGDEGSEYAVSLLHRDYKLILINHQDYELVTLYLSWLIKQRGSMYDFADELSSAVESRLEIFKVR